MPGKTIAAISTSIGIGGVAIIRVSGPGSLSVATLLSRQSPKKFKPRYAVFTPVYSSDGSEIDQCVVTYFKEPNSYTGEDVVEISCHGGLITPKKVLSACVDLGCVLAGPGEFSKRAFLNGKIDLAQAEAVANVIHSKTDISQRLSYKILSGNYSSMLHALKEKLFSIICLIEAELDFSDDEITPRTNDDLSHGLVEIKNMCERLVQSYSVGRLYTEGAIIPIVGAPNVGKSSLINAILKEKRVIVTEYPGTTRDAVEVYYQLDGLPVLFVDTAGIRDTSDIIEIEGIRFSKHYIDRADLIIYVIDATSQRSWVNANLIPPNKNTIFVMNKFDLVNDRNDYYNQFGKRRMETINLSAKTGEGIESLLEAIHTALVRDDCVASGEFTVTVLRHYNALRSLLVCIKESISLLLSNSPRDLTASTLRNGLVELDKILGVTTSADILNNIFATFCVGK